MEPEARQLEATHLCKQSLRNATICAVLGATSLLVLYWFWLECRLSPLPINDAIMHLSILRRIDEIWARGGNILDFWMYSPEFGHALFRSYQVLMYVVFWLLHKTLFAGIALERCLNLCIALTAAVLPWTMYKGARDYGLTALEATAAAVAVVLVHESGGFGIGLSNFTFSGYGTYNQLFASLFLPLAIGWSHQAIRAGRSIIAASLALAATLLSHILTGYMACIWIAADALLLAAVGRKKLYKPAWSLLQLMGLTFLWTCHWIIPMAQDQLLQRHSDAEPGYKWLGHGAAKMLQDLGSGALLDAGRLPVLTLVAGVGLPVCIIAWFPRRDGRISCLQRHVGFQTLLWVAISFGPATWGSLLRVFPFSAQLHWHRFFAGTQMALMLCVGVGIGFVWACLNRWGPTPGMQARLMILVCCALIFPCVKERSEFFYKTNAASVSRMANFWVCEGTEYSGVLAFPLNHKDARYYFGSSGNWGRHLLTSPRLPLHGPLASFNVEMVGATFHHQSHAEVIAYEADFTRADQSELLNVRYVGLNSSEAAPAGYVPVVRAAGMVLYDNGNRSGYFTVGTEATGGCADNDSLAQAVSEFLGSPLVDRHIYPTLTLAGRCQGEHTLLAALKQAKENADLPTAPGRVLATGREPAVESDSHWATVTMDRQGLLVFKMAYHPNWTAEVNGRRVQTAHVLPGFVGIPLGTGISRVRLTYEPDALKKALSWISFVGLVVLCTIQLLRIASRRRRRSHG